MILEPELAWVDGRFRRGVRIVVDAASGRIASVDGPGGAAGIDGAAARASSSGDEVLPLPGRAVLPGFVNAHSHSFQRLIRGRTQWRPVAGVGSDADFWSWREAMYGAALSLSAADVFHVARFCFLEMMRTGVTAVGEFHYLHHKPDGEPYEDPNELAVRVMAAAAEVGIRITLLNVCYAAGGIGRALEDRQRRFRAASPAEYLERTAALLEVASGAVGAGGVGPTVGVAPHSVRAVPRDWLPELSGWAGERGLPVHMHVAEQPAEVEACVEAHGLRPVELLSRDGLLGERFTAVHATHLSDAEVGMLGASGASVCACPTTERDLGDGFLRGFDLLDAGASLCLGTDSHTNLDFLEEMRLVEYHERLGRLRRVVIVDERDGRAEVDAPLLRMATSAGARSLGLDAGEIAADRPADVIAVDLDHPSLAGSTDDTLGAMITLSATSDVVSDVWVGGRHRLRDGRHEAEVEAMAAFRAVAGRPIQP